MENASKALLITGEVLIGLMIFAIFVYEMAFVSNTSKTIYDTMNQKKILEFNAQFERYANREEKYGYLGIQNAISVQEFATICNLAREWTNENQREPITIKLDSTTKTAIIVNKLNKYIATGSTEPLENLFQELNEGDNLENNLELYYFEFKSKDDGILYNENNRRKNM